ncbi:MAG: CDP-alcohol phosphatidyltransferase family protein [Clostridia bacterium]|nr:CDP-alcohol phosphatidyltransferase family protein [Clostridia bacterium]
MITPKMIADKTMTPDKKATAHNDFFAFYIGRPLSYLFTIPFLYTKITPNQISLLSIVPVIAGFVIACFARSMPMMIVCWLMFFLWNMLDGVDGNVARYRKQFSKMGSVYDATSGYLAAAFTFFSASVMAAHTDGLLIQSGIFNSEFFLIVGGISAMANMFPRLVMHKVTTTLWNKEASKGVSDKENFNIVKVIMLNLKSCAGGAQVLFLVAILLNILDLYSVCYCIFNIMVMLVTIIQLFRKKD